MLRLWGSVGVALAVALFALGAIAPAGAQNWATPDRGFRVEWEPASARKGTAIRGYVHNDLGYTVGNVRLLIESLDSTGQVVATTVGYLIGEAPAFDRLYFEVPLAAPAANYRVRVAAWEPVGRGGN